MQRVTLLALAALASLGLTLPPAAGQVSARQGVAPPPETVAFASPMVLDLPLPNVERISKDAQVRLPEVRKYVCDQHVSLLNLTLAKQYRGSRKAPSLELVLSGSVWVAESYDRRVDIALGLKTEGGVLATQTLRNLKAEEGQMVPFRIIVPVEEAKLLAAYGAETPPLMELTLTVRDDS